MGREHVARATNKREEEDDREGAGVEHRQRAGGDRGDRARKRGTKTIGWATSWSVGEDNPIVEEETEVEVPLVQKRRRLTKVGDILLAKEGASSGEVLAIIDGVDQREEGREVGENASARERSQSGDGAEQVRAELPLVVVPFEQAAERGRPALKSQPTRAKMLRALADVQAILCAALGRLGMIEGKRGKIGKTIAGAGGAGGEGSEES